MQESTRSYVIIGIGIIILIISIIISFSLGSSANLNPDENSLEECKTLTYHGENKLNFLFFSDKAQSEEYANFLVSSNPFNEYEEDINFFYIDTYQPECEIYKGVAILCYSRELIKKAASCPDVDIITVLDKEPQRIRSSAYLNVMSINTNHEPTVLLHETGHALANLAEEYINDQNPPRGADNCVQECSEFNSDIDGCFEGCSQGFLQRSVENGVMRTLSPENSENPYGTFNSNIIKGILDKKSNSVITGSAISEPRDCSRESYILYDSLTAKKSVQTGCKPGTASEGDYKYEISDQAGEVVAFDNFNANLFTDNQAQEESELEGESFSHEEVGNLDLAVPLTGDEIEVFDGEGNKISESSFFDLGARACKV